MATCSVFFPRRPSLLFSISSEEGKSKTFLEPTRKWVSDPFSVSSEKKTNLELLTIDGTPGRTFLGIRRYFFSMTV